jgi:hypothetical protein
LNSILLFVGRKNKDKGKRIEREKGEYILYDHDTKNISSSVQTGFDLPYHLQTIQVLSGTILLWAKKKVSVWFGVYHKQQPYFLYCPKANI